jgi:hypothetical protein
VLVDALVAAVLLGVSLAAVVGMVSSASTAQRRGERMEVAAMLLDEQMNMVVARGADQYAQRFGLEGRCDAPFEDYSYELEFDSRAAGEAYTVTVTVSWVDAGRRFSESVQTKVAPRLGDDPDPDRKPEETVIRQ